MDEAFLGVQATAGDHVKTTGLPVRKILGGQSIDPLQVDEVVHRRYLVRRQREVVDRGAANAFRHSQRTFRRTISSPQQLPLDGHESTRRGLEVLAGLTIDHRQARDAASTAAGRGNHRHEVGPIVDDLGVKFPNDVFEVPYLPAVDSTRKVQSRRLMLPGKRNHGHVGRNLTQQFPLGLNQIKPRNEPLAVQVVQDAKHLPLGAAAAHGTDCQKHTNWICHSESI